MMNSGQGTQGIAKVKGRGRQKGHHDNGKTEAMVMIATEVETFQTAPSENSKVILKSLRGAHLFAPMLAISKKNNCSFKECMN